MDKHLAGQKVAAAYSALGNSKKAARCRDCGTVLTFAECPVDGQKRLHKANFCRERLCPMCAWRRSLKWAAEVTKVLHVAASEHSEWGWVMLTLTQRNVASAALPDEIGRILSGWDTLRRRQEFRAVAGWLRTLEVTRNPRTAEWHPHLHALLAVTPSYWTHGYISQKRWRELWADVLGLDYDPSVEVHRVKARRKEDPLEAAAREVGKYTVKDSDLIGDGTDVIARVQTLDAALKGRRLLAWGGELRRIARQVAPQVPEGEEDLVRITGEDHGETCPVCGTEMREHVYRWVQAVRQYVG
ncbi:MAG: protein rep [Firmicutes bacterium]|nr:protein rep [Bacillota bacterium]